MTEICDPLAGWFQYGHIWWHCRGFEDACIDAELVEVSETQARLNIRPSWTSPDDDVFIRTGEYKSYFESGREWRVYCDAVNFSMKSASIRICYIEAAEEPSPCADHTTEAACIEAGCYWYNGACYGTAEGPENANATPMAVGDTVLDITLVRIICDQAQAIIEWGGEENLIGHAMKALLFNPLVYVGIWWIDKECTVAHIVRVNTAIPPEEQEDIKHTAAENHPDATPEEVDEALEWAKEQASKDARWQALLEEYRQGLITQQELMNGQLAIIAEYMDIRLSEKDFVIEIPSFMMAGMVEISGTTSKPNQSGKIMAVNKLGGFDWLASDTEIGTFTSDANSKFTTTAELSEFGAISVYGKIPVVLALDPTTKKHTVLVLTWEILIAILIIAALVYDKSSGGKLKKILKR